SVKVQPAWRERREPSRPGSRLHFARAKRRNSPPTPPRAWEWPQTLTPTSGQPARVYERQYACPPDRQVVYPTDRRKCVAVPAKDSTFSSAERDCPGKLDLPVAPARALNARGCSSSQHPGLRV